MRRLAIVVALLVIAAACGDDDGGGGSSEGSDAFVDAIALAMAADEPSLGDATLGDDDYRCMASSFVDVLGSDGLIERGLTVEAIDGGAELDETSLTEAEALGIAEGVLDCVDFGTLFAEGLAGDVISAESGECVGSALADSDVFKRLIVSEMIGGGSGDNPFDELPIEDQTEIIDIVINCFSAEELAGFAGDS